MIDEIFISVLAADLSIRDKINTGDATASKQSPTLYLLKVSNISPNNQGVVIVQTSERIDNNSLHKVKGPAGVFIASKDKYTTKIFQIENFVTVFIIFILFVMFMTGINNITGRYKKELDDLARELTTSKQKVDASIIKINDEQKKSREIELRNKLFYVKRIISMGQENEIWRKIMYSALRLAINEGIDSKKIVALLFKRSGVTLQKSLSDITEEELIEAISQSRAALQDASSSP